MLSQPLTGLNVFQAMSQSRDWSRHVSAIRKNLEAKNRQLQDRLRALAEEAEKNEAIFRRFQTLEMDLLTASSLHGLTDCLVNGALRTLGLDDVTLVLHDPDHEVRHLLARSGGCSDSAAGVVLVDRLGPRLYATLRQPWLGPFRADHASVFRRPAVLSSVAILPLIRQGCLFGSLNFGSAKSDRYTPHHATDFLSRLAVVTAVCLENVINRERLVISGLTDVLTGWHNRRYLKRRLPEEVARALRHDQPLSALLLDVDHFKRINDKYGHPAGDCVLRDVAARIRQELRSSDVAVRYGGEEFVVVLPQTAESDAVQMAERINQTIANRPFTVEPGLALDVTVSAGIAALAPMPHISASRPLFETQERGVELQQLGAELLHRADAALYRAKAGGRNRVVCDE